MQGDNGNIKEVLGIALLIDYLVIYLIYHCIVVFCLYNETALYNITCPSNYPEKYISKAINLKLIMYN